MGWRGLRWGCFRALGPAGASTFAGWVFRLIGPLTPVSRIAHVNLRLAMPELDEAARRRVVRGVWENVGRTLGEFPHLSQLQEHAPEGPGWFIENVERIDAIAASGGPAILFSGHIGNWGDDAGSLCAAWSGVRELLSGAG